jgi:hypothetical protein
MTEAGESQRTAYKLPGEDPACLQIAVGILGTLLLTIISLLSRWHWSAATSAGVAAFIVAMILLIAAGFSGLRAQRQWRAASLMVAGDIFLTTSALAFLVVSFGGAFSWAFPLGSIFTTLALFSDLATYRFRRAASATAG